jgi:hypothetical protein
VLFVMLVRSKVLAMLLKPEGVGIVSTLDQLALFVAQVSALSLIPTPTRFLARVVSEGVQIISALYSALLKPLLLSTILGAGIATAILLVRPEILGSGLSGYRSVAIVAVLTAPVLALAGFFANVSAAVRDTFRPARICSSRLSRRLSRRLSAFEPQELRDLLDCGTRGRRHAVR